MEPTQKRVFAHWRALQTAVPDLTRAAIALAGLRDAIVGTMDRDSLSVIEDRSWRSWAGGVRDWAGQRWGDSVKCGQEILDELCGRGKPKRPDGLVVCDKSEHVLLPDFLVLAANALLVRSLADQFIMASHHPQTEARWKERLDEI